MLTEKERLNRAFCHEEVDRPPCICPGGMMNMITVDLMESCGITWPKAHTDPEMMANLALASYEYGCFENVGVPFCMTIEAEEMGAEVTMGSECFEPHVTAYAADSVVEWQKLGKMDVTKGRAKVVLDAIRILKDKNLDIPIIGNITGPISTASSVVDPVKFYKDLRKHKEEAHAYLNFVTEQLIIFTRAMVEAGADVIAISDPSGTGEILGPRFFEEYAVKYLNMLLDGIEDGRTEFFPGDFCPLHPSGGRTGAAGKCVSAVSSSAERGADLGILRTHFLVRDRKVAELCRGGQRTGGDGDIRDPVLRFRGKASRT